MTKNQDLWEILRRREEEKRRANWKAWAVAVVVWLILLAAAFWVAWTF